MMVTRCWQAPVLLPSVKAMYDHLCLFLTMRISSASSFFVQALLRLMALLGVRDFLTVVTVVGVVLVTVLLIGAGFKEDAISDAVLLMLSCSACGSSSNQCDSHSASGAFMAFFIVTVDLRKPSVSARSIFSARSSALISLRSCFAVVFLMFLSCSVIG